MMPISLVNISEQFLNGRLIHGSSLHSALGHCAFLSTNISQGSVALRLRCGGIFNHRFSRNLLLSPSVKKCENRLAFGKVRAKNRSPLFRTWCTVSWQGWVWILVSCFWISGFACLLDLAHNNVGKDTKMNINSEIHRFIYLFMYSLKYTVITIETRTW